MAVFKCEKYPNLRVSGAGRFADGVLDVEGEKAEQVRSLVGDAKFGVTEDAPPAPKRGRPRKADDEDE